jgi:hypothetical protein
MLREKRVDSPSCSKKLKARMQGKSCFNFRAVDEDLFKELEDLTAKGFEAFRKGTFGGMKPPGK